MVLLDYPNIDNIKTYNDTYKNIIKDKVTSKYTNLKSLLNAYKDETIVKFFINRRYNIHIENKGRSNSSNGDVFFVYEGNDYTHEIQAKIRFNDDGTIEYKINAPEYGNLNDWFKFNPPTTKKSGLLSWFSRSKTGGKRRKTTHKRSKKGRTTRRK